MSNNMRPLITMPVRRDRGVDHEVEADAIDEALGDILQQARQPFP